MTPPNTRAASTGRRTLCTEAAGLHVRELPQGEGESRTIAGYAIVFGVQSEPLWSDEDSVAREIIAPEAVTAALLDRCDIKFTLFHDRQLILARSRHGAGTLRYSVDEHGVAFEFEAPRTVDGDKALELVRRGDVTGCSFAFSTRYFDRDFVELSTGTADDGRRLYTYTVRVVLDVCDFTLTPDPAYEATEASLRDLAGALRDALPEPAVAPCACTDAASLREAAGIPMF